MYPCISFASGEAVPALVPQVLGESHAALTPLAAPLLSLSGVSPPHRPRLYQLPWAKPGAPAASPVVSASATLLTTPFSGVPAGRPRTSTKLPPMDCADAEDAPAA